MRIPKKAASQSPNLRARRLLLPHHRGIDVRPPILNMFEVAFALQDSDDSQHGVVGQCGFSHHRIKHLVHSPRLALPQHLHHPQFSFGQDFRLSRRHCVPPDSVRRAPLGKVTNYLVEGRAKKRFLPTKPFIISCFPRKNSKSRPKPTRETNHPSPPPSNAPARREATMTSTP